VTPHLKLFRGVEDDTVEVMDLPEPQVRVRLGDLLPLVAMAQKMNFLWLKDFLDDEVGITEDLHQVLQSFRSSRPTAS
jgi:hypothetical protein